MTKDDRDDQKPLLPKAVGTWQAIGFVWDVLVLIAIPTIAFALIGRWLDSRWHTSPLFSVLGLFLALGVTLVLMVRKAKELGRMFRK